MIPKENDYTGTSPEAKWDPFEKLFVGFNAWWWWWWWWCQRYLLTLVIYFFFVSFCFREIIEISRCIQIKKKHGINNKRIISLFQPIPCTCPSALPLVWWFSLICKELKKNYLNQINSFSFLSSSFSPHHSQVSLTSSLVIQLLLSLTFIIYHNGQSWN